MHIAKYAPNMRVLKCSLQSFQMLHLNGTLEEFIKAIGNALTVIHIQELFWKPGNHSKITSLQIFINFLDIIASLLDYVQKYCPKLTTIEAHQIPCPKNNGFESIDCLDEELQTADGPLSRDNCIETNMRIIR